MCWIFSDNPRLDVFKSELIRGANFSSVYELPLLEKTVFKPNTAIPFHRASKTANKNQWVHFYIHDTKFECVWNNPKQYLEMLKKFDGVITPDYSVYQNMPLAMQLWNTYRNRVIGYWLQNNGVHIIPNIRWGTERTYPFAFEGIEQGGTVAVSTNGCIQNKLERYYFEKGLCEMVKTLKPETIICYSYCPNGIFGKYKAEGIEIIQIENYNDTIRGRNGKAVSS